MTKIISQNRFNLKHRQNMSKARKEGYVDKIANEQKLCTRCGKVKSLTEFNRASRRTNGYQLWCLKCCLLAKKEAYHTYRRDIIRKQSRITQLKFKYNLTGEQYNQMLKEQHKVCAICKKPETQKSNPKGIVDSLRVDHCHKTNKIRGLLCSKCNFGLSQFDDKIELLKKAIIYLTKFSNRKNEVE